MWWLILVAAVATHPAHKPKRGECVAMKSQETVCQRIQR